MPSEKIGPTTGLELYNFSQITQSYRNLAWITPHSGELIQQALQRENGGEDIQRSSACLEFVIDSLTTQKNATEFATELYRGRAVFFPDYVLLMDEYNGDAVTRSHDGINPLRHTCNCMASYLEMFGHDDTIPLQQRAIELMTIYYHDFGKILNPKEEMHPQGSLLLASQSIKATSELLAERFLADPKVIEQMIQFAVSFHDLAGNIDAKRITFTEALDLVAQWQPSEEMWKCLSNVQHSDMACVPKMSELFRKNNTEALTRLQMSYELTQFIQVWYMLYLTYRDQSS